VSDGHDPQIPVEQHDRDREGHPERVHGPASLEEQGRVRIDRNSPEEPSTTLATSLGDLDAPSAAVLPEKRAAPHGVRTYPRPTTSRIAMDPKGIVRTGYDVVSEEYRADDAPDERYGEWLEELAPSLPAGARILDLGCGCGVPTARWLLERGFEVTGVDLSEVQIDRARRLVPEADLRHADMTQLDLESGGFDAVVAFYSIIHVPVDEQPELFESIHRWLRSGGMLMAIVGATAGTGTEEDWLGAPMYWSHDGTETYLAWLRETGFDVRWHRFGPEDDGGHTLVLAHRK
jgi:SAM-dependent methyltransferase